MEDYKKTNMKGNESGKIIFTRTEKQLKNVEELITEQTPLSKETDGEIEPRIQVAKKMKTKFKNLNERGIVLNETAEQCFPDVTNTAKEKKQRKNGGCCFCNQCPCHACGCCGDCFKKACCNIC